MEHLSTDVYKAEACGSLLGELEEKNAVVAFWLQG